MMEKLRKSTRALVAAAVLAATASVLFGLSATRLSGDTVGMSLAITAAVASVVSAIGFYMQWAKGRQKERP
jgi:ABC-type branched-subunit amino acid transport system permease subunit